MILLIQIILIGFVVLLEHDVKCDTFTITRCIFLVHPRAMRNALASATAPKESRVTQDLPVISVVTVYCGHVV